VLAAPVWTIDSKLFERSLVGQQAETSSDCTMCAKLHCAVPHAAPPAQATCGSPPWTGCCCAWLALQQQPQAACCRRCSCSSCCPALLTPSCLLTSLLCRSQQHQHHQHQQQQAWENIQLACHTPGLLLEALAVMAPTARSSCM
jgi:hypothetical protein